jgi:signal transduction histidine kinase
MASESRLLAGPIAAGLLVIDDEPQVRNLLEQVLKEQGYTVEVAEDGRQAVEKARRRRFDVAICDLQMPGIDGLEAVSRIQAIHPDIQFIILTAYGTLESAIESLRMGAFDFLRKPMVLNDLLFSVSKALERRDLLERLALFELSRTIFSTLDAEELHGRLLQSSMQVLRADDASLMLLDENHDLYIAKSSSLAGEVLDETRLALGERVAGRVAQQTEPALIHDDVASDERFRDVTPMRRIQAALVCPLTLRGELLGILNVNRVHLEVPYTERDRQSAMILSSLVALSLGNSQLHKEVKTRLRQVSDAQEDIIQSEKMAALANLLSGMAHELNNPLCAVLGYGRLLQAEDLQPKLRKGVEVMVREGERAARIVADLQRFSRREKPEKRRLGLASVVAKVLERRTQELKSSRIQVKTEIDPELPPVLADYQQLLVAFTNLIANAQRAMVEHRGHGTLAITGERKNGRVLLSFADDGPGIAPEHARRIFDPFFTTKSVGQGPGLGLSVCFAIMRDHGGTLRVAGKADGTVFTIELPVAPAEEATQAPSEKSDAGDGPSRKTRATGPRILIADPEAAVQGMLVALLEKLGYSTDTADCGEAALALIRDRVYEALIADIDLPRLDGRKLLEAVHSTRPQLARRVIFLANDAHRPHLMEFSSTSGNLLMGKPLQAGALRDALRRLFPGAELEPEAAHS